ncbi:MAG: hypothetical protein ACRD2J_11485 [Thermoanaerobaculia bacterium]
MTDLPAGPAERYQIAGEGKDAFTRTDLRDRIRTGDLLGSTEIALEGTDDFRPAADFPELARYFSLVTSTTTVVSTATFVPAASVAPPTSVAKRLLPALVYPFTGLGAIAVIGLALFQLLPFGFIAGSIGLPLMMVAVVRVSAEGSTRMPGLAAFGGPGEIVLNTLKVIVLSLLSSWPYILALLLAFVMPGAAFTLGIAALIAVVLYYPACIAILAKYGTIRPALSVSQIWAFISTLGADYALAIGAGFVVLGLSIASLFLALIVPGKVAALSMMLVLVWGTLYVFHLIGWGMYRRRGEL